VLLNALIGECLAEVCSFKYCCCHFVFPFPFGLVRILTLPIVRLFQEEYFT